MNLALSSPNPARSWRVAEHLEFQFSVSISFYLRTMTHHIKTLGFLFALVALPVIALGADEAPATNAPGSAGIEALLSFTNGDKLHGKYRGFTSERRLLWERDDLMAKSEFSLSNTRRIIFRNGRPDTAVPISAMAVTTYGDRISGEIISLDDEQLVLETPFAGTITIAHDRIESLAPNPYGGKVVYQGPFSCDDWESLAPVCRMGICKDAGNEEEADQDSEERGWTHSDIAWYWPGSGGPAALVRKDDMPESAMLRCHISWQSGISLAIAFHSDFQRPPTLEKGEDNEGNPRVRPHRLHPGNSGIYPDLFGNSYVLQLNPTHAMMFRSTVNDEGAASVKRMRTKFNNVQLGDWGSALIEIRTSRVTGEITLFINNEFVAQWSETGHLDEDPIAPPYIGRGNGFGFFMQSPDSVARITEVTVAHWNGMPEAARSMQTDAHDIVLLTNGTDRFSGKVNRITNGRLLLTGQYGDFELPIDEIAEIRFSRASIAGIEAAPKDQIRMHLHPHDIITGTPLAGNETHIRLGHPSCGIIDVDLSTAVIIEINEGHSFLDDWD